MNSRKNTVAYLEDYGCWQATRYAGEDFTGGDTWYVEEFDTWDEAYAYANPGRAEG